MWTLSAGTWTMTTGGVNRTYRLREGIIAGVDNGNEAHLWGWNGSTFPTGISVEPAGALSSRLTGISGDTAVGHATFSGDPSGVPYVWTLGAGGTYTASPLSNAPAGAFANDTNGTEHCGVIDDNEFAAEACYWNAAGTLLSLPVPLDPSTSMPYGDSYASTMDANQIVGSVFVGEEQSHAVVWEIGGGYTILTPSGVGTDPYENCAHGVFSGVQVGYQTLEDEATKARLWQGTAAKSVDLHALLPAGTTYDNSHALSVWIGPGVMRVAGVAQPASQNSENVIVWTYECAADIAEPWLELNFFDYNTFITLYNAGDPKADIAEPYGTLNFFDVSAYIALYEAGCP